MGNFHPSAKMANGNLESRSTYGEDDQDAEVVSLLEENARLRALVTQLSGLVLRHVVNEK
jgi:hypothetical protein